MPDRLVSKLAFDRKSAKTPKNFISVYAANRNLVNFLCSMIYLMPALTIQFMVERRRLGSLDQ